MRRRGSRLVTRSIDPSADETIVPTPRSLSPNEVAHQTAAAADLTLDQTLVQTVEPAPPVVSASATARPGSNAVSRGGKNATGILSREKTTAGKPGSGVVRPGRSAAEGYLPRRRVDHPRRPLDDSSGPADYRIVGQLGRGGTAVVYQAHQRAVDREVALKYLRSEFADNELVRRRFLAEARVIGSLEHPGIIAIHEVALDHSNRLFYSMKRIDGSPWNQQIDALEPSQNVDILLAIADAIRYAHSQQVVHRDLKPENVMLGRFGEILLADWGMAVRLDSAPDVAVRENASAASTAAKYPGGSMAAGAELSASKPGFKSGDVDGVGGTPAYMAPEMTTGQVADVTEQTDVYLLGAILYRIMTGHPPHRGESLRECLLAAADNLIVPTDIQHGLIDIARRAMNTRPVDRHNDVAALIDDIRDHRRHQTSAALVKRVTRALASIEADRKVSIERLTFLESLLKEAEEIWPDNPRVANVRDQLLPHRAVAIAASGDIDTAIETLESAGLGDGELASSLRADKRQRCKDQRAVSRYSALFVRSPDAGLLVTMPAAVIIEVNEQFLSAFGFDRDQIVGKSIGQLHLWVCPRRRVELADAIQRHGFIDDFDAKLYTRDQRVVDVVIAGRRVELEGQTMMVATIRDVSARVAAQNELQRSRDRMKNLQRMAGLATWSYRIADQTITWSDELFRLVGRPISDQSPSRREFYDLVHPEDRDKVQSHVQSAIEFGVAYTIRIRQRSVLGDYQWVTIRAEPLADSDGVVDEIYGVTIPDTSFSTPNV